MIFHLKNNKNFITILMLMLMLMLILMLRLMLTNYQNLL